MQSSQQVKELSTSQLNDKFRRSGQGVMLTSQVQELPDVIGLLNEIAVYDKFTEDNDPYGEHDFGSLMWRSQKLFWKIDYYDQALEYGLDPLDTNCRRLLTVMFANEY